MPIILKVIDKPTYSSLSFPFFCPLLAADDDLAAEEEDVAVAGRFLAVVGALLAGGLLPPLNSTCGPDSSKRSSPPSPLFLGMRKLLCFFLGTWATRLLPATLVGGGEGLLLLPLLLLLRRCRTVDSFSFSSLERFFSRGCFEVASFFLEVVVADDGLSGESLNLPLYSSRMLGAGGGVADLEEEDVAAGGGAASLGSDLRWPGLLGGAGEDDFGGTEEDLVFCKGQYLYDVRTEGEVSLGVDYPKKETLGSKASKLG